VFITGSQNNNARKRYSSWNEERGREHRVWSISRAGLGQLAEVHWRYEPQVPGEESDGGFLGYVLGRVEPVPEQVFVAVRAQFGVLRDVAWARCIQKPTSAACFFYVLDA